MPSRAHGGRGWFMSRLAAAALAAGSPRAARGATPLRLGIAPSDGVTAVVYGARTGGFARAGLDVTIETQSNGAAVAAAVLSGFYDVGNTSLTSLLLGHAKGLPFTIVAPAGVYDDRRPFTGALVLKDSPIRLGADANGQIVGVASLSGVGHDVFSAWVDQHGGDWTSLKFVEIPLPAAAAAVAERRIVASEIASPAMEAALETGTFRVIPAYGAIAKTFLVSAWFTTRDFARKNPETIRAFARVVAETARYANAHHAATAPVMSAFTGIPLARFERMTRARFGSRLDPALIQPVIDAAVKYGTLKTAFAAQDLIDETVRAL